MNTRVSVAFSFLLAFVFLFGIQSAIPQKRKKKKVRHIYLTAVEINERHTKFDINDPIWGLDISHHNGKINWSIIEGKRKPDFLYIKATEGATHHDTKYKNNTKKARERHIRLGSYHFFSYSSSGFRQARNFYGFASIQMGDLVPVLDLEYRRNMPTEDSLVSKEIEDFLIQFKELSGHMPMVYCTELYYQQYLTQLHKKYHFKLWVADYRGQKPGIECLIWQKTDQFLHPGFKGKVDYNVFHGTYADLEQLRVYF
jgi:lysozyme